MEIKLNFKTTGLGFLLTIVFAALKFAGVVNWSWLIVCLPILIGFGLTILICIGMLIFMRIMMPKEIRDDFKRSREK